MQKKKGGITFCSIAGVAYSVKRIEDATVLGPALSVAVACSVEVGS
jgi:hypothetical protein